MWILYQLAVACTLLLVGPFLLARRGSHYLPTLAARWGRQPRGATPAPLWIHAVSVGEVGVAATLLRSLPETIPVVVTTITPTGQARARAAFAGRAQVTYLPFDLGRPVRSFMETYRPRALVLVEGDLWPLVLRSARRRGVAPVVVNGRISDRGFRRMRRLRPLLGPILRPIERFGVQTEEDRRRLLELGVEAERVVTTGNLKFETPEPTRPTEAEAGVLGRAAGRPVILAGSTMDGEEEGLIEAFQRAGGGERALLVVAPRHPERWNRVAQLLGSSGLTTERRSDFAGVAGGPRAGAAGPGVETGTQAGAETGSAVEVLLLDSMGELAGLYRVARIAFIGGTLVPTGGHNPLEAARFGVPVVVGPSMENFREIAEAFDGAGAWRRARDARHLGAILERWLAHPEEARGIGEAGRQLVDRQSGSLERTRRLLAPTLDLLEAGR